jgi:hypothetical protein
MPTSASPSATAPSGSSLSSLLAARPVWLVGVVAAVVAAVATTLVVLVALGAGVPMQAAPSTAAAGEDIPISAFAMLTVIFTAVGTIVAMALARWAKRPAPIFLIVTIVLTIVSFAGPATTSYATTATRLVLDLTHIVAAAIVIPALTLRLAARPERP